MSNLAMGAKVGTPVTNRYALYRGSADGAGLATAVSHREGVLLASRLATRTEVVADAGTAISDSAFEHPAYALV